MKPGKRQWRIASLFLLACFFIFEIAGDKNEPADGIQTKNYKHPRFGNSMIRHCTFSQYWDEQEGRCVGTPGGAIAISIDHTTKCDSETLRAHPSRPNYCYACGKTKTIFAKCPKNQDFDNRLKKCAITDRKQSEDEIALEDPNELYNHVELPPCKEPGDFPVPSNNCVYYTCTTNGFRLYREIFKCPSSNGFDPEVGICTSQIICNGDSTSKKEAVNERTTVQPETIAKIDESYQDQVTSSSISTDSTEMAYIEDDEVGEKKWEDSSREEPDTITKIDETYQDQVTSSPISTYSTEMASIEDDEVGKKKREDSSREEPYANPANVASSTKDSTKSAIITTPVTPLQASTTTEVPDRMGTTVQPEMKKGESTASALSSSTAASTGSNEKSMERSSELEKKPKTTETKSEVSTDLPPTVSGSDDKSMVEEGTTQVPATVAYNTKDGVESEKSTNGKSTDGVESTTETIKLSSSTPSNDQETSSQAPRKEEKSISSDGSDKVTETNADSPDLQSSLGALPTDSTTAEPNTTNVETVKTSGDSTDSSSADANTPENTSDTQQHERKERSVTTPDDTTWIKKNTLPSLTLELQETEATGVKSLTTDTWEHLPFTIARYDSKNLVKDESTVSIPTTFDMSENEEALRTIEKVRSSTNGPWKLLSLKTGRDSFIKPPENEPTVSILPTSGVSKNEDVKSGKLKSLINGPWKLLSLKTGEHSFKNLLKNEPTVSIL